MHAGVMHLRFFVLALVSLPFAACPPLENSPPADGGASDSGVTPDAGDTDAGADAGDLDYRQLRGAPLSLVEGPVVDGAPFAVTDAGFALITNCDGGACDYEWRNDDGSLRTRRENLRGLFGTNIARSGRVASLYEVRARSQCTDTQGDTHSLFEGDWHLVDVATGSSLDTVPNIASSAYLDPAFLRSGLHARLLPEESTQCTYTPVLRTTRVPFGISPLQTHLDPASWVEDELRDGRLLVSRPVESLVMLDPISPSIVTTITDEATQLLTTNGFAHAFARQPVQAVVTYDYSGYRSVRTDLPWMQRDHLIRLVAGRYFVLCGGSQPLTRCEVFDGRAQHSPAAIEVSKVNGVLQLAVAAEAGIVVWARSGQMIRRELFSGIETVVSEEPMAVRSVGQGYGVLLTSATKAMAMAVDATSVRALPGRFTTALDVANDLPQGQTVLIISTSESGGEAWLTAWHPESGRLARLTDSLNFNAPFGAPLTAAEKCNAPGFLRAAGVPADSANVESSLLHFTEFVPQAQPVVRTFVMPHDLSAAPRLLGESAPDSCVTPLSDGARVWFPASGKLSWAALN